MSDNLHNFDFPLHPIAIILVLQALFIDDLNSYILSCGNMDCEFDLAEGAAAESLDDFIGGQEDLLGIFLLWYLCNILIHELLLIYNKKRTFSNVRSLF